MWRHGQSRPGTPETLEAWLSEAANRVEELQNFTVQLLQHGFRSEWICLGGGDDLLK